MSLPNKFKFEVNNSNDIYKAEKGMEGKYTVYTADTIRLFSLPIEEVEEYVGNGSWKIIVDSDNVNHPSHYQGKTEVIEIIEQLTEGMTGFKAYCLGNVAKYLFRHEKKGGIEDLKKARWYLNRVIEVDTQ